MNGDEIREFFYREALLNAMGHRDYRKPGDLQVQIFQDRVEIVNPGGLVAALPWKRLGPEVFPVTPCSSV